MNIKSLKYATYYNGANFADFPGFFSLISNDGRDISANLKHAALLKKDLKRLSSLANKTKMNELSKKFSRDKAFYYQYETLKDVAKSIFKICEMPPLHIVDNLPKPFHKKLWDSMSVDKGDEEHFSIPRGIYYRRNVLTHCYFEFVLSHELIHWIISQKSKTYVPYVTLIEEGLCDFFGAVILYKSEILPRNVIKNLYLYNRVTKKRDELWYSYWHHCKLIISLAMKKGLDHIIEIVLSGRDNLISIYDSVITNTICDRHSKCKIDELISMLLEVDSTYIVSADEYILLDSIIKQDRSIVTIDQFSYLESTLNKKLHSVMKSIERRGFVIKEKNKSFYFPYLDKLPNVKYLP